MTNRTLPYQETEGGMPLVSVIIPCYNREKYVAETVESVLGQTWSSIELLVVDDGSTDGSRSILERFTDRIILLEHPGRLNKGQSASINLGLERCRGEYVAILDSDDLFAPDKIRKQVAFLIENPDIGLVYSNGYVIDEQRTILYAAHDKNHEEHSDPDKLLLDCYFLLPNNALVRRDVYRRAGYFDESLRTAQDHDMALRIAEVAKMGYLGDFLFYYRRHDDSISQKNAKTRWKNGYRILRKAMSRYPYRYATIIGRFAVLNFRLAQCYCEEHKYIRAGCLFLASGLCDPKRAMGVILGHEKVNGPH